jgi:uncharacterized membrane protein
MAGDEDPGLSSEELWQRQHPGRLAGEDFGRILALSDGVFAFAMTLLVIQLAVPSYPPGLSNAQLSGHLAASLLRDYGALAGFVFAFVMIAIWWVVHNRSFQYIARYDSPLVWLNMLILIQIAIMPFVLGVFNAYGNTRTAVGLFAGIQATLGVTNMGLWEYAAHNGLLKKNTPASVLQYYSRRGWFTSAIFAASIGISFVSVTAAEVTWALVFLAQRFAARAQEGDLESPKLSRS